jgi:DNA-binding MarR family transcriptional regulator
MRDERWELIRRILDLQTDLYRSLRPAREWLEVDLTMPQMKVLFLLYSDGGARMSQLASSLGVTLSTVTGIVDRLVEQGMVQRQEHPQDRRLVVCRLTSRGSETVERLHQAGRGRMAALLDGLSVDDLRKVVAGLAVLSAAASPSADQPPAVASTPASWQPKVSSAS